MMREVAVAVLDDRRLMTLRPRGRTDMEPRILLVEDDKRIRQALGLALADEGCQVVEARSGEDALELLASATVDLVRLDLMLPGVDGLAVCRRLRSRGDLPVIIFTAGSDTTV